MINVRATYWLQNSDLSVAADNVPVESVVQIMSVIDSNNWIAQNSYEEASPKEGRECCPAGIGVVTDVGTILHICPKVSAGEMTIHLHQPTIKKTLGIFKTKGSEVFTYLKVPTNQTGWIVQSFLQNESEVLKNTLKRYAS